MAVDLDHHSIIKLKSAVTIKMQKLLHRINIPLTTLAAIRPLVLKNEFILLEDSIIFLPEKSVLF